MIGYKSNNTLHTIYQRKKSNKKAHDSWGESKDENAIKGENLVT